MKCRAKGPSPAELETPFEMDCPSCGYRHESHTGVGKSTPKDAAPKPGDLSLCLRCLSYLQFDDECCPRVLTSAEFLALPDDIRGEMIRVRQVGWMLGIPEKLGVTRVIR